MFHGLVYSLNHFALFTVIFFLSLLVQYNIVPFLTVNRTFFNPLAPVGQLATNLRCDKLGIEKNKYAGRIE